MFRRLWRWLASDQIDRCFTAIGEPNEQRAAAACSLIDTRHVKSETCFRRLIRDGRCRGRRRRERVDDLDQLGVRRGPGVTERLDGVRLGEAAEARQQPDALAPRQFRLRGAPAKEEAEQLTVAE
jgi:hypothetical protein